MSRAVAKRATLPADDKVRRRATPPPNHPLRRAADVIAPAGKWHTYVPAALADIIGGIAGGTAVAAFSGALHEHRST